MGTYITPMITSPNVAFSAVRPLLAGSIVALAVACFDADSTKKMAEGFQNAGAVRPDELPQMVNKEPPFRYPAALYARKVQGNVLLHLYIDRDGAVIPDSTRIEESSGYASLDSAAIKGSQELRFVPAKLHGEPMAVSLQFPVYFRHPEAAPLPGDTILKQNVRPQ